MTDSTSIQLNGNQPPDAQTILSSFEGVISNEDAEKQTERLISLFKATPKGKSKSKICILHGKKFQLTAEKIYAWYQEQKLSSTLVSYEKANWIEDARDNSYTHFLFLGVPSYQRNQGRVFKRVSRSPVDFNQMEYEFFMSDRIKVNNVAVILQDNVFTKKEYKQKFDGHYLNHFVKLNGRKVPSVLGASALGIFAAPCPQPMQSDEVYWSEMPKLVQDFRQHKSSSLGLTIHTREMAEGAPFERIVLINSVNSSDFQYDFLKRVGRYTHIQSINGILLDGLSIEKVTDVFRKLPEFHVQLMVRYVHMSLPPDTKPREEEPTRHMGLEHPIQLPCRQSLTTMSIGPEQIRHKPPSPVPKPVPSLTIPLPVFLLGDNHQLCKELFNVLSDDSPTTPTPDAPTNAILTNRLARNGSTPLYTPQPTSTSRVPMLRSTSIPATNGVVDYRSSTGSIRDSHSSQSSEDISDFDSQSYRFSGVKQSPPPSNVHIRRRSASVKGVASSDRYMIRSEIPESKFEKLPEITVPNLQSVKPPLSPDEMGPLPRQQYILHLPSQDLDRQMVQVYFKLSGIYIVVIGLEDLISNPLCHTENLFYWVNLIHTYVTPDVKRMFIVGMYSRSTIDTIHVLECMNILNKVFSSYRQTIRIPLEDDTHVFLFDRENKATDTEHLLRCITGCFQLFSHSSFYFAKDFYKSIFSPFREFQQIAVDIALNNDRHLLESKYIVGQRYKAMFQQQHHIHLPSGFYETLAAYSPACISRHCDSCLLMPAVIPELLSCCAQRSNYNTQIFEDPLLRNLPVFSIQMLKYSYSQLKQYSTKDFDLVVWWMEHLSIIYSIGKISNDEKFYIPYLLYYNLSDCVTHQWDEEELENTFESATVLYAEFSQTVPMTIHLFHKVVAYVLERAFKEGPPRSQCHFNPDSPDVVLPFYDVNSGEYVGPVWIKYHAIQNIIEFKADVLNRLKFLHAVENNLSKAFLGSKYYNKTIDVNRAVKFRIPSSQISQKTVIPHLWELTQLKSSTDEPEEYLVASVHLTEPGNRRITSVIRCWADRDPEAKELPADLHYDLSQRLLISDAWMKLGAKLNVISPNDFSLLKARTNNDQGVEVLQKWRDSNKTFKDLIEGLKDIHLEIFASRVEEIAYGGSDNASTPSITHSNIMEKKLPVELFLEMSEALNSNDDYWASLGGYLHLLKTVEIEQLRRNPSVNKGNYVLQLWTDSHLTFQDLINGLHSIRLDRFVSRVQEIVKSHLSSK